MELFAQKDYAGNGCGTDGPNVNPTLARRTHGHLAVALRPLPALRRRPRRHGQAVLEVLGFSVSEQIVTKADPDFMIGAFLTCSNKAHDVAFIRQPVKGKFHHASFELGSWEQVLKASDILSRTKTKIDIGPHPPRHHARRDGVLFFDPRATATRSSPAATSTIRTSP